MLNCHLLPDLAMQSSVKGRHTDIQAIPAHIALGNPKRDTISIALETISVSFRYFCLSLNADRIHGTDPENFFCMDDFPGLCRR